MLALFVGSSPRVMAVSTGAGSTVKSSPSGMFTTNKPLQTVHLMTQPQTSRRHQNVVLLQKGSSASKPMTPTGKVIIGFYTVWALLNQKKPVTKPKS